MRFAATMLAVVAVIGAAIGQDMPAEYQGVLKTLGKTGDYKANVLKVGVPRNDLKVVIDGVLVPTSFGFGGWIAMTKGDGGKEVMMGDLVVTEAEVAPVMSAILDHGLEVTALHNHFFYEYPRVFFMHVHGMGDAADLATRVKPALDLITKAEGQAVVPRTKPFAGKIDTAKLDAIVGQTGDTMGAVYKYTIGRDDIDLREMGAKINARMGLNTWAAFFGSDENAIVAGDIAMLEGEVTPVLKALRANGLQVVAIHHHMVGTKPMIVFLHYYGKGPAAKLAEGFKAALNLLGKGTPPMEGHGG